MATDTLRELDSDTTRLLVAGAALALSDEHFAAKATALKELGAKAPALAKVGDQVAKVRGSAGRAVPVELLNLAATNTQIRGAQAKLAKLEGTLEPLPEREKIYSPFGSVALEQMIKAFSGDLDDFDNVIKDALAKNTLVDLRLVSSLPALVKSYLEDELMEKVLQAFGSIVDRVLTEGFNFKGSYDEIQKLHLLALARKTAAIPFLLRAFELGNAGVRAAALEELDRVDPEQATKLALEQGIVDKSDELAAAAITVLTQKHNDDRALDALFAALERAALQWNLRSALQLLQHPQKSARLNAAYTEELRALGPWRGAKKKKGARLTPAQQKASQKAAAKEERAYADLVSKATTLLAAMEGTTDPVLEQLMFSLFQNSKHLDIKAQAGESLIKTKNPTIRAALTKGLGSKNYQEHDLAVQTIVADTSQLLDQLEPYLSPKALADKKNLKIASDLLQGACDELIDYEEGKPKLKDPDPRWEALLLPLMDQKFSMIGYNVSELLSAVRSTKAVDVLIERLATDKDPSGALEALETFSNPKCLPAICALLDKDDKNVVKCAYNITGLLNAIDDPSAAPSLRGYLQRWEEAQAKPKKGAAKAKKPARSSRKTARPWAINQLYECAAHLERKRESSTDSPL